MNWFIITIGGYVWGEYFIRVKDKKKFYKFWPIILIAVLLYFYLCLSIFNTGLLANNAVIFYYMSTIDAIACIILVHGLCGLYYCISNYLPNIITKELSFLSKNVTKVYILQWFFIPLLVILFCYFFKNTAISTLTCFIISISVLLICRIITQFIQKTNI